MGVRYNALAILAALAHRDRTGEGQFIDMAQAEAALHFLAPAALAYLETKKAPEAHGNRDASMAPHGVYPTRGTDRWVAIAVRTDDEWRQLCRIAQLHDLASGCSARDSRRAANVPKIASTRRCRVDAQHDAADIERELAARRHRRARAARYARVVDTSRNSRRAASSAASRIRNSARPPSKAAAC